MSKHAAKIGDGIIITQRPKFEDGSAMLAAYFEGYEIGDIGVVLHFEASCVRVKWMTNKGNHKGMRICSILPDEYEVLAEAVPEDTHVLKELDHLGIGVKLDEPTPYVITGRDAQILDRVRVTEITENNEDFAGVEPGDVGEVVQVYSTSIRVKWLTNIGKYDPEEHDDRERSLVLYTGEYEIIPYSEPLP